MDCIRTRELISEYSAGMLRGGLASRIEAHLASCSECRAELQKLERVMLLVEGLSPEEPPIGLWNGVYNKITAGVEKPEHATPWDKARIVLRRNAVRLSVGFATAALAAIIVFTPVHTPSQGTVTATGSDYFQGHIIYASQDALADEAALNSVAALTDREQFGI